MLDQNQTKENNKAESSSKQLQDFNQEISKELGPKIMLSEHINTIESGVRNFLNKLKNIDTDIEKQKAIVKNLFEGNASKKTALNFISEVLSDSVRKEAIATYEFFVKDVQESKEEIAAIEKELKEIESLSHVKMYKESRINTLGKDKKYEFNNAEIRDIEYYEHLSRKLISSKRMLMGSLLQVTDEKLKITGKTISRLLFSASTLVFGYSIEEKLKKNALNVIFNAVEKSSNPIVQELELRADKVALLRLIINKAMDLKKIISDSKVYKCIDSIIPDSVRDVIKEFIKTDVKDIIKPLANYLKAKEKAIDIKAKLVEYTQERVSDLLKEPEKKTLTDCANSLLNKLPQDDSKRKEVEQFLSDKNLKVPNCVMEYAMLHDTKFQEINKDLLMAQKDLAGKSFIFGLIETVQRLGLYLATTIEIIPAIIEFSLDLGVKTAHYVNNKYHEITTNRAVEKVFNLIDSYAIKNEQDTSYKNTSSKDSLLEEEKVSSAKEQQDGQIEKSQSTIAQENELRQNIIAKANLAFEKAQGISISMWIQGFNERNQYMKTSEVFKVEEAIKEFNLNMKSFREDLQKLTNKMTAQAHSDQKESTEVNTSTIAQQLEEFKQKFQEIVWKIHNAKKEFHEKTDRIITTEVTQSISRLAAVAYKSSSNIDQSTSKQKPNIANEVTLNKIESKQKNAMEKISENTKKTVTSPSRFFRNHGAGGLSL